jgi:hypothetical protein
MEKKKKYLEPLSRNGFYPVKLAKSMREWFQRGLLLPKACDIRGSPMCHLRVNNYPDSNN